MFSQSLWRPAALLLGSSAWFLDGAIRSPLEKIIGGYECPPNSQPWQVYLTSNGQHWFLVCAVCLCRLYLCSCVSCRFQCWMYPVFLRLKTVSFIPRLHRSSPSQIVTHTDTFLIIFLFFSFFFSSPGDSGGPVGCNGELWGVVSLGEDCPKQGKPGVHAEVCRYIDWTKNIINCLLKKWMRPRLSISQNHSILSGQIKQNTLQP
uniref:trypsin n=1 Tax=Sinocyclocheilus rhinocerous TaxID=307959 RepID=A0A673JDJ7_9TELE